MSSLLWLIGMAVAGGLAAWRLLRSLRRWTPVQGRDEEARQAQARLSSTLSRSRY